MLKSHWLGWVAFSLWNSSFKIKSGNGECSKEKTTKSILDVKHIHCNNKSTFSFAEHGHVPIVGAGQGVLMTYIVAYNSNICFTGHLTLNIVKLKHIESNKKVGNDTNNETINILVSIPIYINVLIHRTIIRCYSINNRCTYSKLNCPIYLTLCVLFIYTFDWQNGIGLLFYKARVEICYRIRLQLV